MKRIAIVGSGGAGKSTLARQLGAILDIPVTHLDSLHWKPNWTATPSEEWKGIEEQLVQKDTWIIDGNYTSTVDIRFAAADTIIFLDFPRLLCLYRAFKRRLQYNGKSRPDMAKGCPERIDWQFVKWIWNYPKNVRVRVLRKLQHYESGRQIVILRSPQHVKQLLKSMVDERTSSQHTVQID